MKKRLQGLLIGVVIGVLFSGAIVYGSTGVKWIDANYSNIKLVINGIQTVPKDVTGKVVEPFIYDGTTYLPVRAVSEALGYNVSWDGNTRTVYVGESNQGKTYLGIDVKAYNNDINL